MPTNIPINVGRIEVAMNNGSHHMNCYKTDLNFFQGTKGDTILYDKTQLGDTTGVVYHSMIFRHDGVVDTEVVPWQQSFYVTSVANNSQILIEAQVPSLDWTLPTLPNDTTVDPSVRGKKSIVVLQPHQNMIIENHYVNATVQSTPNGMGKVLINLYYATEANTTSASMYFGKYTHLHIPAHTMDYTVPMVCQFPSSLTFPIYVLGMTGHFHSHGKTFFVDVVNLAHDSVGNPLLDSAGHQIITVAQPKIYINATWSEPPFKSFDTPIKVNAGQTLRYTAIYDNPTDSVINFGGHVLTQEHDNLFAWFVPGWFGGNTVYDNGP
ncbi:MAG TPA: hypothetical protein VEW28_05865 [Candidatus Kapabacteria bacterium]|nr:hypothetical protein [Candidatus Kapabacteria bacterium]